MIGRHSVRRVIKISYGRKHPSDFLSYATNYSTSQTNTRMAVIARETIVSLQKKGLIDKNNTNRLNTIVGRCSF